MKVEGSNITITDSVYNKMSIIPKGACEQDSYSGKNKLNASPSPNFPQQIKVVTDNLPNEYQEVEYIESSGTQYILTNYVPNIKTQWYLKFNPLERNAINGSGLSGTKGQLEIGFIDDFYFNRIISPSNTNQLNTEDTTKRVVEMYNYPTYFKMNDTTLKTFTAYEFTGTMLPIALFARNSEWNGIINITSQRIYACKISEDNVLKLNLIPCYRKSDNVIGMYDRVNGVFYTNQGTGTFAKGSNVYSNEIVVGGNIFDGIIETGSIYKGNNSVTDNNIRSKNYSEVIGGETYNFYVNGTLNRVAIVAYDTNHSWIGDYGGDHGYQTETGVFTVPQNAKYIRFRSYQADYNLFNTGTITIIGAKETYPIHLGTNYLAGIGTYKDEIVGKTDDWKIRRNVGKVVLNGSENWQGPTNNRFEMDSNLVDSTNTLGFCNYFKNVNTWQLHEITNNSAVAFKYDAWQYGRFSINSNEFADTTELKTWLSTHNTIMYYIHATPTEETITDQILIADLNNMYQAMSYDGKTNITVTSEDTNAQMEVEVTYTSESDMCEKLLFIFNKMKDKLYHIIRSL